MNTNMCRLFIDFVYMWSCIGAGDPIIKRGRVRIPLIAPHLFVCSNSWPRFQTWYVAFFLFCSMFWFVDVCGIVDHHCLNLFIGCCLAFCYLCIGGCDVHQWSGSYIASSITFCFPFSIKYSLIANLYSSRLVIIPH